MLPFRMAAQRESALSRASSFSPSNGDFPLVVRFARPEPSGIGAPAADCLPDKGAQRRLSQFVRAGAQGSRRVFL
jgi:hypothetical protein